MEFKPDLSFERIEDDGKTLVMKDTNNQEERKFKLMPTLNSGWYRESFKVFSNHKYYWMNEDKDLKIFIVTYDGCLYEADNPFTIHFKNPKDEEDFCAMEQFVQDEFFYHCSRPTYSDCGYDAENEEYQFFGFIYGYGKVIKVAMEFKIWDTITANTQNS